MSEVCQCEGPFIVHAGSLAWLTDTPKWNGPNVKFHSTIIPKGQQLPPLEKCLLHCQLYHCPFCCPAIFKPTTRYKVHKHLDAHFSRAIEYQGYYIHKCNLGCRPDGHFHCFCQSLFLNRNRFMDHLSKKHSSPGPPPAIPPIPSECTAVESSSSEVTQDPDQASPFPSEEPRLDQTPASQPEQPVKPAAPSYTSLSARRRSPEDTAAMIENQWSVLEYIQKPLDEDEQFLLSLAPSFKRLPNHKKAHIRLVFEQALYEAECEV